MDLIVGPGYSEQMLDHIDVGTGKEEKVTFTKFLHYTLKDRNMRMQKNKLLLLNSSFFKREIFPADRHQFENARRLRKFILDIVLAKKKMLEDKKDDEEVSDLISLLIYDDMNSDNDGIIDDIIVLFITGSTTTQVAVSNLIVTSLFEAGLHDRILQEVDPLMKSVEHDPLNEMTIEKVDEMEHMKLIYMETMRRNPPGPMNTGASVNGTVTIDGI